MVCSDNMSGKIDCDPATTSHVDSKGERGSFFRQLVRSISLEDIICDDEVYNILSDYEYDYDYPLPLQTQAQPIASTNDTLPQRQYTLFPAAPHVSQGLPHQLHHESSSHSQLQHSHSQQHLYSKQQPQPQPQPRRQQLIPGYTVDHYTGVTTPIKITSNVGAGKGKEFSLRAKDTGLVCTEREMLRFKMHLLTYM